MGINSLLPYRLRNRRDATRHARAIEDILQTPPVIPRNDGLVLFSMIGTAVILPYLVAVKSLWNQLGRGRIVLLDDGTLTGRDKAVLARHCGDPEILAIRDVKLGPFPAGGTWERFLTILDRRQHEYWVQLNSDTVTMGPVPDILQAIASNRSFILLGDTEAGAAPLDLAQFRTTRYPDGPEEGHIQTRIESRLDLIPEAPRWHYIRGCSGFAGFAAGGQGRPLAASFMKAIEKLLGSEALSEWGTEQVASNFQISNDPNPVLLPYERYLNYWGEGWSKEAAFIHFVGTYRYHQDAYKRASRIAIDELKSSTGWLGQKGQ
ncbi:hypothetical protein D6851_06405 [Altericroceibacterium spongiae]|uniref:Uncharacterized protein n=1 Tax=Altericroceibacterium spongiae TaxID=2320269 RepID=A0A420EM24_9SPHN|nr:hypothetical protein [Altericroceibacterium spongiae]RKF21666.1 hypothetical protein D6851_06405 [Altericroceibacterium spongiae]